ncbi:type II toxin-antitoxin system RelE/ParE family toxin [Methylobacterium sp. NEAU 140]|uniref:type II toxin-antitoxin system RelE/ParE family toxin n=1 Tax=Methylobacterium sp. NEAU 140 TaxID=3064945 RepID=UPI0027340FCE|nr:type II toxin-antitoxin system RelE/ParE family toxin [Methylobacterium sp. NEAU 140]MDP4026604.1 type II toxin-antitoxin system RelE/ParE family toxin [Methylobacterium sp. NEAU 140]
MSDYTLTQRAEADLFDIFVYGYRQFGVRQAEAYAASLEHAFRLLADNPGLGRKAEAIRAGVRRHECASHVILYEPADSGVLILAVVHGRSVERLAL